MSITLDLGICTTSQGLHRAQEAAQAIADAVTGTFLSSSSGDVVLAPRIVDAAAAGIKLAETVQSDQLHRSLEAVTGRQRGETKITHVGLLLAGLFEPRPDFFGLMFDDAFIPGSSNPWVTTPREGCAVFLSAIAGRRANAEFLNEAIYTAVHELGHVVNLQHSSEPSFMATSAGRETSFPLQGCEFDTLEHSMLSQCSVSRFVWPGGSAFGDMGPFAVASNPIDASANLGEPLQLRIGMEQDSFWQFEPVELDIQLILRSGGRSRASVPDMVDPGYQRFVIWIEEPTGERRRYLSRVTTAPIPDE